MPEDYIDLEKEQEKRRVAEGFHRGERWAFEAVARDNFAYITNFVAHLLKDRDRGLELAQEAFFLACRSHKRFDPKRDLVPWLFQIARNLAYKEYNRKKGNKEVSLQETMEGSHFEPASEDVDPRRELLEQESMERIERSINKLKPKYRDVVILRVVQGLPSEKVAAALDIPVATVNTHTHRALQQLRRLAQQEGLREDEVFS